jgi:hypothetical protein
MSVHAVQNNQQDLLAEAVSNAQAAQKQADHHKALPEDKLTISVAAQAKQTASAIGADGGE